jgi:hypothetical protein
LLTDFGPQSAYVGQMKLVLHRLAPRATVLDLAHDLPAGNVAAAALALESAHRFLPDGAVVVVVVDPGVGSQRRIVAARYPNGLTVLVPDNGILPGANGFGAPRELRTVSNARLFLKPVSAVFHGRDVFAPVAAKLACGAPLNALGPSMAVGRLTPAPCPEPVLRPGFVCARVVLADRFGNLITNLRTEQLGRRRVEDVRCGRCRFPFVTHYAAVEKAKPLALIGSHGRLELAVRDGSAAARYAIPVGREVRVRSG